jgi:hypothetical protein
MATSGPVSISTRQSATAEAFEMGAVRAQVLWRPFDATDESDAAGDVQAGYTAESSTEMLLQGFADDIGSVDSLRPGFRLEFLL